jgi:hypothetical protein
MAALAAASKGDLVAEDEMRRENPDETDVEAHRKTVSAFDDAEAGTEGDDEPDVEAHRKTVSRDDSEPGEGDRGRKQL